MTAFVYPSPHVRRHGPQGYGATESYRPWLRDEFTFRCVYCLFREQWGRVKAAFELDHFIPVSIVPEQTLNYENLLYACSACNAVKANMLLPDPTQVFTAETVHVGEDGRITGKTRESRRLIRLLALDGHEENEARMLWIGIIALAKQYDHELFDRLMGFPDDLPDLSRLRPPGGNNRHEGLASCYFAQRHNGTLPTAY